MELKMLKVEAWPDEYGKAKANVLKLQGWEKELHIMKEPIGMAMVANQKSAEKKKTHNRYVETKNAKAFVNMGVPKWIANLMSRSLYMVTTSDSKVVATSAIDVPWDPKTPMCYAESFPVAVHFETNFGADYNVQAEKLRKMLNAPGGRGARGYYHCVGDDVARTAFDTSMNGEDVVVIKPESCKQFPAFSVVVRHATCRMNNTAIPCWGHGMWILPRAHVAITVVDLATVIQKATLTSLDKLGDALEDRSLVRTTWPTMGVKSGEAAWIPYGSVPLVAAVPGDESDNIIAYAAVPFLGKEFVDEDAEVSNLINAALTKFLKTKAGAEPWDTMQKSVSAFVAN